MKTCGVLFAFSMLFIAGNSSAQDAGAGFIRLIVPESDTTVTGSPKYRLSASTNPGRNVTINGKSLNVYPSGAFAGLLDLPVGENLFTITSIDAADTVTKTFLVIRTKPLETTPADSLRIERVMMQPSSDLWLNESDLLEVQFKGTPDCKATFLDGMPMRELAPSEANGLRGIYRGVYKVKATDTLTNSPVTFRLEAKDGQSVTRESRGRASFKSQDFPLVGVTKWERPYLNFGLGEDRLGGAKLSFINPGIRLTITGKEAGQYRVALTKDLDAWVPEEMVDLQPRGTFVPSSLSGNWNVYGDEKNDYVAVSLGDRLPYSSSQEVEPTRVIVDVYGAVSNTNWITQQLTTKEIKNVYYNQVGKDLLRITIELKHRQVWGYSIGYNGNTLVIKLRRQPEKLKIKALTFALDAGHGGPGNNGALGSTGAYEKDVNLATVYHLKRLLEKKGAKVVLTRKDDSLIPNSERLKKAINSGADMLISIHSNSIGLTTNPEDTKGLSTYYKYICYRPLSMFIMDEVLKTGLTAFGNVGSFNFTLNSPTELPNVLVELAYMSNPEDEMKLLDDDFREKIAKRIVDGIDDFLDYCDE